MGIEIKSTGTLIDELMTASQRCWHAQDKLMDKSLSTETRLAAAETAQLANAQRSKLVKAIDERLDGASNVAGKTYA